MKHAVTSNTSRVTLAATAVTLVCLGGILAASPQTMAAALGNPAPQFAPLQPNIDDDDAPTATVRDAAVAADGRETSQQPVSRPDSVKAPSAEKATWDTAGARITSTIPAQEHPAPTDAPTATTDIEPDPLPRNQAAAATPSSAPTAQPSVPNVQISLPEVTATPEPSDELFAANLDLESPDSVTVIVNKMRPLPEDFEPEDLVTLPATVASAGGPHELRQDAATATSALFDAAAEDGVELLAISAYRSADYQRTLYDSYVVEFGTEAANRMSAMPGYSEHQTGLALDVDVPGGNHTLRTSFGQTAAGQWLAANAHDYGFVIRYPQDAQDITGFSYEPWHLRYFGEDVAQRIVDGESGIAETEFELDPAPTYQP